MANLGMVVDPANTPRTEPEARPPLPDGTEVLLHATQAEVKPTQKGGTGINIRDEVIDGPHQGHVVFSFINIANPSQQAQAIGQSELANRCDACGLGPVSDSDDLLYRPFRAVLGVKAGQQGYPPKNVIRKYIPKDNAPAGAASPAPAPAPAPASSQQPVQAPAQQQQAPVMAAAGQKKHPWD